MNKIIEICWLFPIPSRNSQVSYSLPYWYPIQRYISCESFPLSFFDFWKYLQFQKLWLPRQQDICGCFVALLQDSERKTCLKFLQFWIGNAFIIYGQLAGHWTLVLVRVGVCLIAPNNLGTARWKFQAGIQKIWQLVSNCWLDLDRTDEETVIEAGRRHSLLVLTYHRRKHVIIVFEHCYL